MTPAFQIQPAHATPCRRHESRLKATAANQRVSWGRTTGYDGTTARRRERWTSSIAAKALARPVARASHSMMARRASVAGPSAIGEFVPEASTNRARSVAASAKAPFTSSIPMPTGEPVSPERRRPRETSAAAAASVRVRTSARRCSNCSPKASTRGCETNSPRRSRPRRDRGEPEHQAAQDAGLEDAR
jgi:hypothetical protein